jgi:hypothetical protein
MTTLNYKRSMTTRSMTQMTMTQMTNRTLRPMITFLVLNSTEVNDPCFDQLPQKKDPVKNNTKKHYKGFVSKNQPKLKNNTNVEVRFNYMNTKKYYKGFVKNQVCNSMYPNCIQYLIEFHDGDSIWMYLSKKNWKREMTSEEYIDSINQLQYYCKRMLINKRINNSKNTYNAINCIQNFVRRLTAKTILDNLKKQDKAIRCIQTFSRTFSKINNCSIKELAEITNLKKFGLDYVLEKFAEQCNDDGYLTRQLYYSIMRTFIKSNPSWRQTNQKHLEIQVDKIFELYAEQGREIASSRRCIDFINLGTVMSLLTKGSKKERMRIICDLYEPYEDDCLSKIAIMDYLTSVFTILFNFKIENYKYSSILNNNLAYSSINMVESTVNDMFDNLNLKETDYISFDTFYNWMNNTNDLEKNTIKTTIKTTIKSQLRTRSGKTYNR